MSGEYAHFSGNVRIAAAAADTSYVGVDVIAEYHKRNLRIFANIAAVAEPGDRIIVIFGTGCMPYLRPLVRASPRMVLVEPNRHLSALQEVGAAEKTQFVLSSAVVFERTIVAAAPPV